MTAHRAVASDPILLSRWNHDYRLSLRVILAGIVILAVSIAFGLGAAWTGSYLTSGWGGLAVGLTGTAGFMLIVLGGSWAYTNRRLLELSDGNT